MRAGVNKNPPRKEDEKPDLLEQMIRNGPPATVEAIAVHAVDYMVALEAIEQECADDPQLTAKRTIYATKCLIAGLSPPGSSGPAHLFAPLMEIILALETGASPAKTMLFKAARRRGGGRPPDSPARVIAKAKAAAVMTMLTESGLPDEKAARLVANRLQRAGVRFDRRDANPTNNVSEWLKEAKGLGEKPMNLAYRDALYRLRALIKNSDSARQALLKAVDELAGLFG